MEKIALFVNDAEHAARLLRPLLPPGAPAVQWVVVGCAPKLTHRIGKWVAHRQREQWREQWARTLRSRLQPVFPAGHLVEWELARGPLDQLADQLRRRLGTDLRLLDARRPTLGAHASPLDAPAANTTAGERWATPVAVGSSLALVLALTD